MNVVLMFILRKFINAEKCVRNKIENNTVTLVKMHLNVGFANISNCMLKLHHPGSSDSLSSLLEVQPKHCTCCRRRHLSAYCWLFCLFKCGWLKLRQAETQLSGEHWLTKWNFSRLCSTSQIFLPCVVNARPVGAYFWRQKSILAFV